MYSQHYHYLLRIPTYLIQFKYFSLSAETFLRVANASAKEFFKLCSIIQRRRKSCCWYFLEG